MYGLDGLGTVTDDVTSFLAMNPTPTSAQITLFLQNYSNPSDQSAAAQALVTAGVDAMLVSSAMQSLSMPSMSVSSWINSAMIFELLAVASAGVSAYHGVKRNHGSIGWGVWWFLMGGLFPVITPIIAIAQKPGFAKPK